MSQAKPFFSVVVPVHNKAPYLRRSIGSVLQQKFADFELILVDDASTDGGLEEIRKFADPRIRVFQRDTPGAGGYAARNLGIQKSQAEWVAFLDADDEWYADHLQILHGLACEADAQVVAAGWFNSNGTNGALRPNPFSAYHAEEQAVFLDFSRFLSESAQGRPPLWTSAMAAKTSLFKKNGGFPEQCKKGGDTAAWLRLVAASDGIHVATARTAVYHRDASTVTWAVKPEVRGNCVYETVRKLLEEAHSSNVKQDLMRVSNLHVLFGLKERALDGELSSADFAEYYLRAGWGWYLLLRAHSFLPRRLQPPVWRVYQRIRRLG